MQVAETTRPLSSNEIATSERSTGGIVSEEKYNLLKRQLRDITEVATIRYNMLGARHRLW